MSGAAVSRCRVDHSSRGNMARMTLFGGRCLVRLGVFPLRPLRSTINRRHSRLRDDYRQRHWCRHGIARSMQHRCRPPKFLHDTDSCMLKECRHQSLSVTLRNCPHQQSIGSRQATHRIHHQDTCIHRHIVSQYWWWLLVPYLETVRSILLDTSGTGSKNRNIMWRKEVGKYLVHVRVANVYLI